jgi:hypothetical protein
MSYNYRFLVIDKVKKKIAINPDSIGSTEEALLLLDTLNTGEVEDGAPAKYKLIIDPYEE